jgi:hypothetical protein
VSEGVDRDDDSFETSQCSTSDYQKRILSVKGFLVFGRRQGCCQDLKKKRVESCAVGKNGTKAVVCGFWRPFSLGLRHGHNSHTRQIGLHDLSASPSTPISFPKEKSD